MTENDYERIKEIIKRNRNTIKLFPNVIGLGVGKKIVKGRITDVLAIRIYIIKKISRDCLNKMELIPEQIEGIPTDVIEIGKVRLLGNTSNEIQ